MDVRGIVQKYERPLLAFLQELVRLKSVNGRHPEQAVAERIVAEAQKLGLNGRLIAKESVSKNSSKKRQGSHSS